MIIVIGSTEAVHMICGYLKGLQHYDRDRIKALEYMISKVYRSTIMTSVATTVGFLSFAISSSYAIREFGCEGAIAMATCAIVSLFFIPLLLSFFVLKKSVNIKLSSNAKSTKTYKFIDSYSQFVLNNVDALIAVADA